MTSDAVSLAELEARIRAGLPALRYAHAEFNTYGEDNYVVVLDGTWVVRFPRSDAQRGRFVAELNLLERLRDAVPIAVPRYTFVAADKSFGAYRLIDGREMTPPLFRALKPDAQRDILAGLGRFLATLHAVPVQTLLQPDGTTQRCWSGTQFAAYYRSVQRAQIAVVVDVAWLARFDAFHDSFVAHTGGIERVAHGDLSDDHILIAQRGTLAGIIDFTDAAAGDAAIDFAYFWRLGEDAVDRVLSHYVLFAEDPGLKDRARWTFVRYLINQIAYGDKAKWNLGVDEALKELDPHLTWCGV